MCLNVSKALPTTYYFSITTCQSNKYKKFSIGSKDTYNQLDYILFDEPFTKMKSGFSNERTHCIPRQIQYNKYVNGTNI